MKTNKKKVLGLILILILIMLAILIFTNNREKLIADVDEAKILAIVDNPYDNYPPLPTGFTAVSGTTVATGYTIKDASGNEFVWIPADSTTFKRTEYNLGRTKVNQTDESGTEYTALQESVNKYQGFYIGKYEASSTEISKAGVQPESEISQTDAKTKCSSYSPSSQVVSHLIYGTEWDTTLEWIKQTTSDYVTMERVDKTNTEYGNFGGTLLNTGASNEKQKNVYDLSRKFKRMDK